MASPASPDDSPKSLSPDSAFQGTNPVPLRWDEQEWGAHPKADTPPSGDEGIDRLLDEAFPSGGNPLGCAWGDDKSSDASSEYVREESVIDTEAELDEILDEGEPPEDYEGTWNDSDVDIGVNGEDDDDDDGADDSCDDSDTNSGGDDAMIAIPPRKRRPRRANQ
jgi:hypothetical protein